MLKQGWLLDVFAFWCLYLLFHLWWFWCLVYWQIVKLLNVHWLVQAVLVILVLICVPSLLLFTFFVVLFVTTVAVVLLCDPILNFGSRTRSMGLWQPPRASFSVFQFALLEIEKLAFILLVCFTWRAWLIRVLGFVLRKLDFPLKLGSQVSRLC